MRNLFVTFCLLGMVFSNVLVRTTRRSLGPVCHGCPAHFCDDDIAIIKGYCCGCARFYDNLPIKCSSLIQCPLNGYELCRDYEYMMHCCCNT